MKEKSYSYLFSQELINALEEKRRKADMALRAKLEAETDKGVDVDPLPELPMAKMKLYGYSGLLGSRYFGTEQEFIDYINDDKTSMKWNYALVIEYLGNVAGKSNVFSIQI